MKLKQGLLLLATAMLAGTTLVSTPVDAAPKKTEKHCVLVLGEDHISCYASQDEIVVGQNHILQGIFYDAYSLSGSSLSIYNNHNLGGCGGSGAADLAALGWDNKISSFDNRCGLLVFYANAGYSGFTAQYGGGRFSLGGNAMDNQASSFRWP